MLQKGTQQSETNMISDRSEQKRKLKTDAVLHMPPNWLIQAVMYFRRMVAKFYQIISPPSLTIHDLLRSIQTNKMLGIAAEMRIADYLADGPKTGRELSRIVGGDPDALERMLRAMVSQGLLGQKKDGRFKNNAASILLRVDHPKSMRDLALLLSSEWYWEIWNKASHRIKTGDNACIAAHGASLYEYLKKNPDKERLFANAMANIVKKTAPMISAHFDFSDFRRICDIGGGNGMNLIEILKRNQHLQGILFDLPHVIKKGENNMSAHDLNGRCQCLSGGFFESVPEGCDLYMMQKVLHNWNDERCLQILANVKKVLPPKGRLLILDMIIPKNSDFHISRILDFTMLIMLGEGRERTESEFRALLERAGFRLKRIIPLTIVSILEVEPE